MAHGYEYALYSAAEKYLTGGLYAFRSIGIMACQHRKLHSVGLQGMYLAYVGLEPPGVCGGYWVAEQRQRIAVL